MKTTVGVALSGMNVAEFVLKATPPRMPRALLERAHLRAAYERHHDATALLVTAPAGFGKTTLLMRWRQRWIDDGMQVAWLSCDAADQPARFTVALTHALRVAGILEAGPPDDDRAANPHDLYAGLTKLLAFIAGRPESSVGIVIDDAERLPDDTVRRALQYLLLNAPANLHIAIGSRMPLPLLLSELGAKGRCVALGVDDLRLRFEESDAILVERLGSGLGLDDRARLHDATEGWPIGLQLAISAVEREADPARAARELSARHGTLQEYFVTSLISHLPPDVTTQLVRAAILEHFNTNLFQAVTGCKRPRQVLDQLVRETPLVITGERSDWVRLHPLARDFLLSRFEALPQRERAGLHARASTWYAERERFHEAASHALAAGNESLAQSYAARALWILATNGMLAEAREWLDRLPQAMVAGDTDLRLIAASVLALGDRNDEALAIAHAVLDQPETTPRATAMALRIGVVSALFADRPGQIPPFLARWPEGVESHDTLYAVTARNSRAVLALHEGETEQVRALIAQQAEFGESGTVRLAAEFGRMLASLSHLWDGHPARAEASLLPALLRAEHEGRRSMIASLHASFVALACLERGYPTRARILLGGRLDVIERCGFPDNVLCAYRTLAGVALAKGDEQRAHAALQALDALGARRGWPRLRAAALAERVRLHAVSGRKETMVRLLDSLEALAPDFDAPDTQPLRPGFRLVAALSRAHAALAFGRLEAAELHLAEADALAEVLNRGGDVQRVKMLRAVVASQRGDPSATELMREARELAAIGGHARLAAETHPIAERLAAEVAAAPAMDGRALRPIVQRHPPARTTLLTSKEAEVLDLLGKGLPNKAIARVLDVSGETVKWHLKNLYVKLSAGSRQHAVERARMMGLVS